MVILNSDRIICYVYISSIGETEFAVPVDSINEVIFSVFFSFSLLLKGFRLDVFPI